MRSGCFFVEFDGVLPDMSLYLRDCFQLINRLWPTTSQVATSTQSSLIPRPSRNSFRSARVPSTFWSHLWYIATEAMTTFKNGQVPGMLLAFWRMFAHIWHSILFGIPTKPQLVVPSLENIIYVLTYYVTTSIYTVVSNIICVGVPQLCFQLEFTLPHTTHPVHVVSTF